MTDPSAVTDAAARYAELEARYQGIIDAAVDAIIIIDERGIIETFNHAAERIFGYAADEVIGRNVAMLMPEPDAHRHDGYMREYLDGGPPRIIGIGREVLGRRKSGQTFPLDLAVGEVKTLHPRRFVGIARDITRRRTMERELADREHDLSLIFDGAPIGIFTTTLNGRFTRVNAALAALIGYAPSELLQLSCGDLTLEEDRAELESTYLELAEGSRADGACELRWRHRHGGVLAVTVHAVLAGGPRSHFILGQVVDRTQQLRSERESIEARERLAQVGRVTTLGEMASAIAHEINQPLTAISAYAQACKRLFDGKRDDPAVIYESLEAIVAQALRAGDIVRRIRQFVSHRESGRARADLNDILRTVLQLAAIDASSNDVQISTALSPDLPPILVDPVQIQQVCLNLIRNAIDAMLALPPAERRLRITSSRRPGQVEARFVDNGPGVAPEMRARLFQPFQTTKTEGMGMGLSISNSIVAAHGGLLQYFDHPGGGAVFCVILPESSS